MDLTVSLILLILALIAFILAALRVKSAALDVDWQALGFAFVVGSWIAA